MKVTYSQKGTPIADHLAMETVLKGEDIHTSSEIVILALRVAIKKGYVDHSTVNLVYQSDSLDVHRIPIDGNGNLYVYPNGFCDYTNDFLMELI